MMDAPDYKSARQYALERLERELPASLIYHSVAHTRDDVVPAAERLASLHGIEGEDRVLLLSAAWFHDLGYIEQRDGHEAVSIRIAGQVLPHLGYNQEQVRTILSIIQATKIPQSPTTLLQEIIADADLDVLGREDDFWRLDQALRSELAFFGSSFTDEEWYARQLAFLLGHSYFTAVAKTLRDIGKQRNIQEIRKRIDCS